MFLLKGDLVSSATLRGFEMSVMIFEVFLVVEQLNSRVGSGHPRLSDADGKPHLLEAFSI